MKFRAFSGASRLVVIFAGFAVVVSGCTPPPPPDSTNKSAAIGEERCGKLIDSAFDMLKPQRLGVDSRIDTATNVLNDWMSSCGASSGEAVLTPEQQELLAKKLPEDVLKRVTDTRFTQVDGLHIRDSLLWKDTTAFAIHNAEDDLARIVELFNYVIRNIALLTEGEHPLQLTPFEIAMFGRGTAEDRAWLFAEILRQLRIDAVILRPRDAAPDASGGAWLVGALLDNGVYLFEPRLGTPVPSLSGNEASATVRGPATLAEAAADDAVLRQLDRSPEKPYPLKASDLQKLRVEVIGNSSFFSPRMRRLQQSLSGERSLIIYDSLEDTEVGPGLIARVTDFGGGHWGRDQVGVWQRPEENLVNYTTRDQRDMERLIVLQEPFGWPPEFLQNSDKSVTFGRPKRGQFKIRLNQITGELGKTIHYYNSQMASIPVQIESEGILAPPDLKIPPEVVRKHARAAEDALYWIGVCQLETGEYRAASEIFLHYLTVYGDAGSWSSQSRFLRARCIAELGEFAAAAQLLEQAPSDDVNSDGNAFFVRRWKAVSAKRETGEVSDGKPTAGTDQGADTKEATPQPPAESGTPSPASPAQDAAANPAKPPETSSSPPPLEGPTE